MLDNISLSQKKILTLKHKRDSERPHHIYEASGFYQVNREFGNKVDQVLENAGREIRSMLEAELARLESEFNGIIVGTELNTSDDE